MANGSMHEMAFIKEEDYGVTPDDPEMTLLRHTGTTLALNKDTLESNELRKNRQIIDVRHGTYNVGGDISIELSYGTFDEILAAILCTDWVTDTLKSGTKRTSFTIQRYFSDMAAITKPYHVFKGVEFNTFQLDINANDMLRGSFSVFGQTMEANEDDFTGVVYKPISTTPPLDSFSGTLLEDGAPIAAVTQIQLNINNNLEPRYIIGQRASLRPSMGNIDVSGQITAYFEDSNLINKFINEAYTSLVFTTPDLLGNIYEFNIPKIKLNSAAPDVSSPGPITLAIPFQAMWDPTQDSNIVITRQ